MSEAASGRIWLRLGRQGRAAAKPLIGTAEDREHDF
jgi:hypothetical protein